MNPQPSAEALRLAQTIQRNARWNTEHLAGIIDAELQLPQRNAALLLAQGVVDTWNVRGYPDNGELLQLRDALAAITIR